MKTLGILFAIFEVRTYISNHGTDSNSEFTYQKYGGHTGASPETLFLFRKMCVRSDLPTLFHFMRTHTEESKDGKVVDGLGGGHLTPEIKSFLSNYQHMVEYYADNPMGLSASIIRLLHMLEHSELYSEACDCIREDITFMLVSVHEQYLQWLDVPDELKVEAMA